MAASARNLRRSPRRAVRLTQRRQAIVDAAARIFHEVGYERATLDSIGDAVGLSKASLYYYVRSKDELVGRLLAGVIEEIERRAEQDLPTRPTAEDRLRRFVLAHVEVICRSPTGMLLARQQDIVFGKAHARSITEARHRHEAALEAILRQGIAEKAFRPVDARTIAYLVFGALNGIARWHAHAGKTPEDIAGELFMLVASGLRASNEDREGRREAASTARGRCVRMRKRRADAK